MTNNSHWTGEATVQEDTGMVARFRQRFGSLRPPQQKPPPEPQKQD